MRLSVVFGVLAAFMSTAALAQKPVAMTADEAAAKVTAAGYTNVTGCAQKKAGHGAFHCSAVPSTGGAAVPVVVDPHGGVHKAGAAGSADED